MARLGISLARITVRDQVAVEVALADQLGIETFAAVIGGSMGGLRALEWLVGYPERVASAALLACCAAAAQIKSAPKQFVKQSPPIPSMECW